MAKYFTFKELVASSTADKKKINNVPSDIQTIDNIIHLMDNLDILREAWGAPIHISSGYRCKELNTAVGGSKTSTHVEGSAADTLPNMADWDKYLKFVREYLKDKDFDQCILETVGTSKWIHISYGNRNRKMFLKTTDGKTYQTWNQ